MAESGPICCASRAWIGLYQRTDICGCIFSGTDSCGASERSAIDHHTGRRHTGPEGRETSRAFERGTRHCWGHLASRPPFVGLLTRHRQPSGPGPNMSHGIAQLAIAQLALSGPHRPDDWSHIVAGPEPLQTQLTSHPNGSRLKAVMVVNRLTSPARGPRSGTSCVPVNLRPPG